MLISRSADQPPGLVQAQTVDSRPIVEGIAQNAKQRPSTPAPKIDAHADRALREMSTYLQKTPSLSFHIDTCPPE